MKHYAAMAMALIICAWAHNTLAQALSEGAALLFKGTKSNLSVADKNMIYKNLAFNLSKDKKMFVDATDEAREYPFGATASVTDMNSDGKEEVFVSFGNSFTSGAAGASIVLYIKNGSSFQTNLGFPGMAEILPASANKGYPDIVIGGPGFSFPVWRWNGKEYAMHRQISDQQLGKAKAISPEELSKQYQAGLK